MSSREQAPDPDDFFAETRMSFGEHIEDLRSHLVRALKWFAVGMLLGFFLSKPVLEYITRPVDEAIHKYYEERRTTVGKGTEDPSHPLNQPPLDLVIEAPAKSLVDALR